MDILDELMMKMIHYNSGDPKRIQHFLKVHSFARLIGLSENLDGDTQLTLEAAAIVHDIGIKPAEEKYGYCNGKLQEQEGPEPAEKLLRSLGFRASVIDRVSYLVGHHHTYSDVDGMDYQILLEADFLVNLFEEGLQPEAADAAYQNIFRTGSGKKICEEMFF